jgi:hypothetical protein
MFNEKSLTPSLEDLGYRRLKRLTYKASWSSTDVEHFLFFLLYDRGNSVTCWFGVRNAAAEQFAVECLKLFGGPLFHDVRFDHRYDCHMQFSLGMWAGWGIPSSLKLSDMSEAALVGKVSGDIRDTLFPVIRPVLSVADLFVLLLKDEEPCRWGRVSGTMRGAMIVFLGRRLGIERREIETMLQPYLKDIGAHMGYTTMQRPLSPSAFLTKVLDHADQNGP